MFVQDLSNAMWQGQCDKCNVTHVLGQMHISKKMMQQKHCHKWNVINKMRHIQYDKYNVTNEI